MYRDRATSPIFDVPEFAALRRVKPLPKRRRTSTAGNDSEHDQHRASTTLPSPLLNLEDATAEELLAHADSLTAQMALQSYYTPVLGSVQDLFRPEENAREGEEEGDYIDHLTQPGNTKKRKVPANAATSPHDVTEGISSEEELSGSIPTRFEHDAVDPPPAVSPAIALSIRRGKLTRSTLAGLQHKEMLKVRRKQLSAVLGALSHGDTLALDQALSAHYPFFTGGPKPVRIRLSSRPSARAARLTSTLTHSTKDARPASQFTFVCHSATSDRLVATKKEVAVLRTRFEAELARQAAKAKSLAAANKLLQAAPPRNSKRTQDRRALQSDLVLDATLTGMKPRGKKKKRSALANASNPHHLRNYVPSRLPHSQTSANGQPNVNDISPPPLRFLSAEIPPRRSKRAAPTIPSLTNPADEWICPYCDYKLFYADEQEYRKAVKLRKKILRRRRRARERAAAATSSTSKGPPPPVPNSDDYEPGYAPPHDDEYSSAPKPSKFEREVGGVGGEHDAFG